MIRLATQADLPQIMEIYRPYVKRTTYTFEYDMPSLEDFTQRFFDITAQYPWLVWQEEDRILGYAYGSTMQVIAEMGDWAQVVDPTTGVTGFAMQKFLFK
jgi:phosphinothricin acetyltransferase